MKTQNLSLIFLLLLITLITFNQNAQTVGKLYSKSDANNLYGQVITSVSINSSDLQTMLSQTSNYIMFSIINGNLVILDNIRKPLYPVNMTVTNEEVFHVFSVSMVQELLTKGSNAVTFVENRQNVLTITNSDTTLEESQFCPPFCVPR